MADVVTILLQVFVILFVVGSMLAMGFSLTVGMIVKSLRNWKLDLLAVAANFLIVPVVIIGLSYVIPLPSDVKIGFLILSLAAGAPFLPKLTQFAKGDVTFAVCFMILLMVLTVVILPLALPLLISGASVSTWSVAQPLIFLMLIPLFVALGIRHRYLEFATHAARLLNSVTTLSILALMVLFFVGFANQIEGTIGTGTISFSIFFIGFSLVIGYILGGHDKSVKRVAGLGTAQRNISAGLLVSAVDFSSSPMVGVTVLVISITGLIVLMVTSGEWGRRSEKVKHLSATP